MADLLIRDIDPAIKQALQARAAKNGRSQQAEAKAIVEEALGVDAKPRWLKLHEAALSVGGIDLELPERRPARPIDTTEWA